MIDTTVSPKNPSEAIVLTFDFTNGLLANEILSGSPTVTVATAFGTDASPTSILNGASSIDSTGRMVLVPVQAGLDGCDYEVKVVVPTNNIKKTLALIAILPVRK